jgi:hypothetical protein
MGMWSEIILLLLRTEIIVKEMLLYQFINFGVLVNILSYSDAR